MLGGGGVRHTFSAVGKEGRANYRINHARISSGWQGVLRAGGGEGDQTDVFHGVHPVKKNRTNGVSCSMVFHAKDARGSNGD